MTFYSQIPELQSKETILKAARKNALLCYKGKHSRIRTLLTPTPEPEKQGMIYFKFTK